MGNIYFDETSLWYVCLSKSNVFIWHKHFSDGRNTLEDDKHTGRPSSSKTPESIEKVREFVANNRSASLRMMAEVLHINKETIRTILHEDLGKTKVCAKFVPHTLTGEQKSLGIAHCSDIISAYENDSNFLKSIVTDKVPNGSQKTLHEPKKREKCHQKIKTMLITFFDSSGIIHKEFVPAGQTITGEIYLKRFETWCLLHDNAPSHSSLIVRRFLAKNNVCVLNHPPYSPDLAPCDLFIPKNKIEVKRSRPEVQHLLYVADGRSSTNCRKDLEAMGAMIFIFGDWLQDFTDVVKARISLQDDDVSIEDTTTKPLFTPQEKGPKVLGTKFQDFDGILGRSTSDPCQ
ncbi:hypothetical protein LAZ67_21001480 [Cordylochernes scorpioides]|uniref:Transposase n=1 Tax=Cordylochernes scorpioides TaxID=51811 RepID=A0ABY6LQZ8_9ARAC|nr:hypothetical protein LAZ67_21001480 [Cordylochernes scorpioides]